MNNSMTAILLALATAASAAAFAQQPSTSVNTTKDHRRVVVPTPPQEPNPSGLVVPKLPPPSPCGPTSGCLVPDWALRGPNGGWSWEKKSFFVPESDSLIRAIAEAPKTGNVRHLHMSIVNGVLRFQPDLSPQESVDVLEKAALIKTPEGERIRIVVEGSSYSNLLHRAAVGQ